MTKLAHILGDIPLLRRRRHWRYVSRGRRTVGLVLLALLSIVLFGYIYLPMALGEYARDEAERYLGELTAGRVEIRGGKFRLWGTLELQGVRVEVLNASAGSRPLLTADSIVLRHRPWSLLSGSLDVTEIVCVAPTLTLDYDAEKGRLVAWEMLEALRRGPANEPARPPPQRLPLISFRQVQLQTLKGRMLLDITMSPEAAGKYRITLQENRPGGQQRITGSGTLDVVRGTFDMSTEVFIANIAAVLPDHYAKWKDKYGIDGKVLLNSIPAKHDPNARALEAVLEGVRLRLSEDEGGLSLTEVSGRLIFDANELRVSNLSGKLPQAGGATLRLDGRYGGYDPNSPFELEASVRGLSLPSEKDASGPLRKILAQLRESLRPGGAVDVAIGVSRGRDGRIAAHGTAWPRNMTATYVNFPYPVSDVTGSVEFDMSRVRLKNLSGRRGDGRFTLNGTVDIQKAWTYDLTIDAEGASFDETLRAALPENIAKVWTTVSPSGIGGAKVRIWRQGKDDEERTDARLVLDGRASVAYDGFPYRLEKVSGAVRIQGDEAELENVQARHGPASVTLRGTVGGLSGRKGHTRVTIDANDLPFDEELLAAMPPRTRRSVEELHATGRASRVRVKLSEDPGEKMDMRIEARVEGASFKPDVLPYAVTDANGELTILADKAVVHRLAGRHGQTPVTISGKIAVEANEPGTDLLVTARALQMDGELLAALPESVKTVWRDVKPEGQADIELAYRELAGDAKKKVDYRLVLDSRGGMSVRHESFPYPLRNITGRAVATPGRVELQGSAVRGESKLTVAGVLSEDANCQRVELTSVRGTAVPVDSDFLAAMPSALGPISKRFQLGGTCELDLKSVRVITPIIGEGATSGPAATATAPTTAPATARAGSAQPTTAPAARWSLSGMVAFRDASVDLGMGHKKVTGGLVGNASQTAGGLAIDANVAVDSMVVARQKLTDLSGRLTKDRSAQIVRVSELAARAYGGRATGVAEVRLSEPPEFGLNLMVEEINLEELARVGLDAGAKPDVKGKLSGTIHLQATPGGKPGVRAAGMLRLTEGSLYRLPVMLGLLNVFFLQLPGDTAFTDGSVSYRLQGDTLVFEEIYLRGPALSILGSGTMSMKTEMLKLNFLTGPPRKLPRLGSIDSLLAGISREVVEIHVRGPLRKPQMRTVPLRALDAAINELLNPGKTEK